MPLCMTQRAVGPEAALHLAQLQAVVPAKQHTLLAPTLIRFRILD